MRLSPSTRCAEDLNTEIIVAGEESSALLIVGLDAAPSRPLESSLVQFRQWARFEKFISDYVGRHASKTFASMTTGRRPIIATASLTDLPSATAASRATPGRAILRSTIAGVPALEINRRRFTKTSPPVRKYLRDLRAAVDRSASRDVQRRLRAGVHPRGVGRRGSSADFAAPEQVAAAVRQRAGPAPPVLEHEDEIAVRPELPHRYAASHALS